jgi:hypothetical protein
MADDTGALPPLPDGFTLQSPAAALPPLPDGYTLQTPAAAAPAVPAGTPVSPAAAAVQGDPGFAGLPQDMKNANAQAAIDHANEIVDPRPDPVTGLPTRRYETLGYKNPQDYVNDNQNIANTAAGVGDWINDKVGGIKQISNAVLHKSGLMSDEDYAKTLQDSLQKTDDTKKLNAPLEATGGGAVGKALPTVAALAAAPELIPAKLAAAGGVAAGAADIAAPAAVAAADGAASELGTGDSRAKNAAIEGGEAAAGGAVVKAGGKLLQYAPTAAAKALQGMGVDLNASDASGNPIAKLLTKFTGGNTPELAAQQQAAVDKAVVKSFGGTGDAATSEVVQKAHTDLGKVYDDLAARNGVKYDTKLQGDLDAAHALSLSSLEGPQQKVVQNQYTEILKKVKEGNGTISGDAYQNIRGLLQNLSKNPDPAKAKVFSDMQDALDTAFHRSVSPADSKILADTDKSYRNLKIAEGSIDTSDGAGHIDPAKLTTQLAKVQNRALTQRALGDQTLPDLSQNVNKVLFPSANPYDTSPAASGPLAHVLGGGGIGGALGAYHEIQEGHGDFGDVTKGTFEGALGGAALGAGLRPATTGFARQVLPMAFKGAQTLAPAVTAVAPAASVSLGQQLLPQRLQP